MSLSAAGRTATTTLAGGAYEMWLQGSEVTAVIVAFCAVVAPALYVALHARGAARGAAPARAGMGRRRSMRWVDRLRPWSMNEVLLLGILVALTKIAELATVIPGAAMFAVGALVLLLPWLASTFDPREVWRRIAWVSREAPMRHRAQRRSGRGCVACRDCGLARAPRSARRAGPLPALRRAASPGGTSTRSSARGRSSSPPRSSTCRRTCCRC